MLSQFLLISAVSATVDYRTPALLLPAEFDPSLHRDCEANDESACRALVEKRAFLYYSKGPLDPEYNPEEVIQRISSSPQSIDRTAVLTLLNNESSRFHLPTSTTLEDHPVIVRYQQCPQGKGRRVREDWINFWEAFESSNLSNHLGTLQKAAARTVTATLLTQICNPRRPVSVCDTSLDMWVREELVFHFLDKHGISSWDYTYDSLLAVINTELDLIDDQAGAGDNRFPDYITAASAVPIEFDRGAKIQCSIPRNRVGCDSLVKRFAAACGIPKTDNESDESFLRRLSEAFNHFDVDLMRVLMKSADLYPRYHGISDRNQEYDDGQPIEIRREGGLESDFLSRVYLNLRLKFPDDGESPLDWNELLRARSLTDVENIMTPAVNRIEQFYANRRISGWIRHVMRSFCPTVGTWPDRLTELAKSVKSACELYANNPSREIHSRILPADYISDMLADLDTIDNITARLTADFESALTESRSYLPTNSPVEDPKISAGTQSPVDDPEDAKPDDKIAAMVDEAYTDDFQDTKQPGTESLDDSRQDAKLAFHDTEHPVLVSKLSSEPVVPTGNDKMNTTVIVAVVVSLVLVLGGGVAFLYYRSHNAVTL